LNANAACCRQGRMWRNSWSLEILSCEWLRKPLRRRGAGRESPPGGRGAGTGPGGLWRLGQPLWVGSWYGRSWGSSRSASGVGALKSERTSSRGPGTAFAEGPAQRETAKAEVHGGAAVPRARRGAKPCPTPTEAERPRRLSDQLRSQNGSTCLGPSGIWAEPLLPVAVFRAGSAVWTGMGWVHSPSRADVCLSRTAMGIS
jgi:hypothetical protein